MKKALILTQLNLDGPERVQAPRVFIFSALPCQHLPFEERLHRAACQDAQEEPLRLQCAQRGQRTVQVLQRESCKEIGWEDEERR